MGRQEQSRGKASVAWPHCSWLPLGQPRKTPSLKPTSEQRRKGTSSERQPWAWRMVGQGFSARDLGCCSRKLSLWVGRSSQLAGDSDKSQPGVQHPARTSRGFVAAWEAFCRELPPCPSSSSAWLQMRGSVCQKGNTGSSGKEQGNDRVSLRQILTKVQSVRLRNEPLRPVLASTAANITSHTVQQEWDNSVSIHQQPRTDGCSRRHQPCPSISKPTLSGHCISPRSPKAKLGGPVGLGPGLKTDEMI